VSEQTASGGVMSQIDLAAISVEDPYPVYERMRAAPMEQGADGFWFLLGYEDVSAALADRRLSDHFPNWPGYEEFAEATWGGVDSPIARLDREMFMNMDPPDHTRIRTLFTRAFTPRMVERLRSWIERQVEDVLDAVEERGRMDVMGDLALPLTIGAICQMLGVPEADRDACRRRAYVTGQMFGPAPDADARVEVDAAIEEGFEYFSALVDKRRDDPQDDLITALAQARDRDDRLTTDEIAAAAILLFDAGHETTAALIGNTVHALLEHPDQLALLRERPERVPDAIEESLRYETPFQYGRKVTLEAVEYGGVTIPPRELILVLMGAANRDPERYTDPGRFDLTRADRKHLAFGHGPHFCLGAALARLESSIAIGALLRRWPELELAPEGPRRPEYIWSLRSLASLPVTR
jgi:pimeloyl-[acyl-carrier protein] synthase